MIGKCAKQTVTAEIITQSGEVFRATNSCNNPQEVCPRIGMKTGEGYELCKSVCEQTGHAEINALRLAGEDASGATMYLYGHTYVCDNCKAACDEAGIKEIVFCERKK